MDASSPAAKLFKGEHPEAEAFRAILYGSLSKTGKGHGTDRAIIQTMSPVTCEVIFSEEELAEMKHPNTMDLIAVSGGEETVRQRFYSIGGGDIRIEGRQTDTAEQDVYMENSFAEIKQFCQCSYIDLLHYIEINEEDDIWGYLGEVWLLHKITITNSLNNII